jgi:hypothetical protein
MIVYRENDYNHFLFNGEWPVAIRPHLVPWGKVSEETSAQQAIENTEKDIPLLQSILNNPRKKTFTCNGVRHIVSQRGKFIND